MSLHLPQLDTHPPGPVMRTPDAAAYVGLSPSTMNKLRLTGHGPPFVKLGRSVGYRREDLTAWLDSRTRRSTKDRGTGAKASVPADDGAAGDTR